ERADLSGLPFAMGDSCRTKGERSRQFTLAVATVRQAQAPVPVGLPAPTIGSFSGPFGGPPGAGDSTFVPIGPGGVGVPGAGPQPPQPSQPPQAGTTGPITTLTVVELA